MSKTDPNTYRRVYHWLYVRQSERVRAEIRAAVNSDRQLTPEVELFIKRVIELAEMGEA